MPCEVLEMLIVTQLIRKFFTVHVTQKFINILFICELVGKPVNLGAGRSSKLCKKECDVQEF
jgi:hypothetical protein